VDTPITVELICHVHERIFGTLYTWAGRWRTVNISKPGVTWPPPADIAESMAALERDVLRKYSAARLTDDGAFCRAVAEIQGEFLVIHPFREGNARTIKLTTDLLAAQTDRPPLAYDKTDAGREAYIAAASQAFSRNYAPMEAVIRRALETARKGPAARP
jgi:cell filamentation protein